MIDKAGNGYVHAFVHVCLLCVCVRERGFPCTSPLPFCTYSIYLMVHEFNDALNLAFLYIDKISNFMSL